VSVLLNATGIHTGFIYLAAMSLVWADELRSRVSPLLRAIGFCLITQSSPVPIEDFHSKPI